jgi:hypothetical protein
MKQIAHNLAALNKRFMANSLKIQKLNNHLKNEQKLPMFIENKIKNLLKLELLENIEEEFIFGIKMNLYRKFMRKLATTSQDIYLKHEFHESIQHLIKIFNPGFPLPTEHLPGKIVYQTIQTIFSKTILEWNRKEELDLKKKENKKNNFNKKKEEDNALFQLTKKEFLQTIEEMMNKNKQKNSNQHKKPRDGKKTSNANRKWNNPQQQGKNNKNQNKDDKPKKQNTDNKSQGNKKQQQRKGKNMYHKGNKNPNRQNSTYPTDFFGTVIQNIRFHDLTKGQAKDYSKALSLGLKYIPTEQNTMDKEIQIDNLIENIKEKDFILNHFPKRKQEFNPIFKLGSNKKRKLEDKNISTLTLNLANSLKKELELACKEVPFRKTTQHYANLAKSLLAKPDIKIVPAEKNLGLTAMKIEDCYGLCMAELDNPDSYELLGKLNEHRILAKMKLLFDNLQILSLITLD